MRHPLAPKAKQRRDAARLALRNALECEYGWRRAVEMRSKPPSEQESIAVVFAMAEAQTAETEYAVAVETDAAITRLLTRSEP